MLYNSGPWTLVRIVEVSVIGGVRFRRFHCICPGTDIVTNGNKKVHNKNSNKKTDLLLYRELVTFLGLLPWQHFASQLVILLGVKC